MMFGLNDFNTYLIVGYLISLFALYFKSNSFSTDITYYNLLIIIGLFFGFLGFNLFYNTHLFDKLEIDYGNSYLGSLIFLLSIGLVLYFFSQNLFYLLFKHLKLIPLLIGIGKIGCYFNGCCSGKSTYLENIPIQIIESSFHLILFIILFKENNIVKTFKIFFISNLFIRVIFNYFREEEINSIFYFNIFNYDINLISILYILLLILSLKIIKSKPTSN